MKHKNRGYADMPLGLERRSSVVLRQENCLLNPAAETCSLTKEDTGSVQGVVSSFLIEFSAILQNVKQGGGRTDLQLVDLLADTSFRMGNVKLNRKTLEAAKISPRET